MKRKETIRLIGVDLDGTLLNDEKKLCSGAAETIRKAGERGIKFVPITGRPLAGIPACVRELPEVEYIISSNGAQIMDNKTEKTLYSFSIDNETSVRMIRVLRGLRCRFEPFADGVGYAEPEVYDYYKETFSGTPLADYIFSSRRVTERIESLFEGTGRCADEFFINCESEAVRAALTEKMDAIGGLQYCFLGDRFMEITKKGTDKGEALEVLCRHLDIPVAQTMAFGDGENDLLFLKKAGVSVAMKNAFPSVKENADIIADTNNNNGVCKIIETLLF